MQDGYIEDFVSGQPVKASREEVDAVQVFSRMLVLDYGYPKEFIQTRPQWRVKVRPSDTRREYPVDIAVFDAEDHRDDNIQIIVECKKPNRRDGKSQLKDYLRFSSSQLGVWFNGDEKLFLKKTESKGKVLFEEIPNIPKHGERVEDIGLYKRRVLKPAHNLKSVFRTIRHYLAANAVGITRDEVLAQQIINLVFCKIYDERFTRPDDTVEFRAGIDEDPQRVSERIKNIFENVRSKYSDVIDLEESISLDSDSLTYVVGELQSFCLIESERDAIADAFETFIGPSLKGGQGQFFTPRNVVKLLVKALKLEPDSKVIDPACGSGGFLVETLKDAWRSIEDRGNSLNWPESEILSEKQEAAIKNFRGIDKDSFLSKVAKAYMAIVGDGRGGVYCENSLDRPGNWQVPVQQDISLGSFDIVVTNPPFGRKLKIDDTEILSSYHLGHKWTKNRSTGQYAKSSAVRTGQPPQILFVERCLDLLRDGGRLGIIVPESMICNPSHRYIVQYIKSVARIKVVISLPEELFQPYTHAKTCAVVIEKIPPDPSENHDIFMAIAKWCGHDSRGLPIPYDDLPQILANYLNFERNSGIAYDHKGFVMRESDIHNDIYVPKYYNPEIQSALSELEESHDLLLLGDLVERGILSYDTGDEVGKLAYGSGNIPFIRTSDIANWEIKLDPKHGLSEDIYDEHQEGQDVRKNDILMVRDGTYLVGTCALISKADTKIVYQSHLYKIRSNDVDALHPYLLLAVLSSPIVKEQIFAKQFTQDIIDSLGGRILELVLPIPKSPVEREEIISKVDEIMEHKSASRELTREVILSVADSYHPEQSSEFFTISR